VRSARVAGLDLAISIGVRSPYPRAEVVIGRSLALCVHPYAAWRARSAPARLFVVLAYLVASYGVTLLVLLAR
jgi:hypothetical protein